MLSCTVVVVVLAIWAVMSGAVVVVVIRAGLS